MPGIFGNVVFLFHSTCVIRRVWRCAISHENSSQILLQLTLKLSFHYRVCYMVDLPRWINTSNMISPQDFFHFKLPSAPQLLNCIRWYTMFLCSTWALAVVTSLRHTWAHSGNHPHILLALATASSISVFRHTMYSWLCSISCSITGSQSQNGHFHPLPIIPQYISTNSSIMAAPKQCICHCAIFSHKSSKLRKVPPTSFYIASVMQKFFHLPSMFKVWYSQHNTKRYLVCLQLSIAVCNVKNIPPITVCFTYLDSTCTFPHML